MSMPNALYGGMAHAACAIVRVAVGGLLRGAMQGVLDDALDALVVVVAFTASSRAVDEALKSALVEASSPLRDGVLPGVELAAMSRLSSLWPLAERCALDIAHCGGGAANGLFQHLSLGRWFNTGCSAHRPPL